MQQLLSEIRSCTICSDFLPLGPKPVITVTPQTKILIIGQAPGTKVHASGIPWDDLSGKALRRWLGVDDEVFYNSGIFGVMAMGMCYPGKGTRGDLPPRPECAKHWHHQVLEMLPNLELTLLIGMYAQQFYLGKRAKSTLAETVKNYRDYLPEYFPLVHPSPRNIRWHQNNPWFEEEVVPALEVVTGEIIQKYLP